MDQWRCVDPAHPHESDDVWHDSRRDAEDELVAFHGLGATGYRIEHRQVRADGSVVAPDAGWVARAWELND